MRQEAPGQMGNLPPVPGMPRPPGQTSSATKTWLMPAIAAAIAAAIMFPLGIFVGQATSDSGDEPGSAGLAADVAADAAAEGPTILVQAVDSCGLGSSSSGIDVGDDGYSLDLDNEPSGGLATVDLVCILDELGISDAVISRMESTRALDGTQTAEQDGLTLSWTYHPDDGLDVIISLEQP